MRSEILFVLFLMLLPFGCGNSGMVTAEDARKGELLFNSVGCTKCHSVKGDTILYGPPLKSIYGKEVVVSSSGKRITLTIDRQYIIRSITDPDAEKLAGYENKKMTPVNLSTEEIESLADYLIYISGNQL
jgi:hypothetical protein